MLIESNTNHHPRIYYRIVSLWVICEAFAGGIMHGLKLPFSGLIVSGLAVTCIVLIARFSPGKGRIIKAMLIVSGFKLMLGPTSPPTAFIAVCFQGLMGELLFSTHRYFKLSAILLAFFALVESAIQRILILLIIYGAGFWKALNEFIHKFTKSDTPTNYSLVLAYGYILLHAVISIFVGSWAVKLATQAPAWQRNHPELMISNKIDIDSIEPTQKKARGKIKLIFLLIWLFLFVLLAQAYWQPDKAVLPSNEVLTLIIRALLVLLTWHLFLSPLVMIIFKKVLSRQQTKNRQEFHEVIALIPQTKYLFVTGWKLSGRKKGLGRLKLFLKIVLINVLAD